MIFGVGQVFRDKDTTLASFYSQPKNTIDVITVGSSHVNSAVIPAVFWKEYGINAHNVYSWSQPIWIGYHYIKEALRFQKPEVVVVDLFGMMYGNSDEQPKEIDKVNYRNSFSIKPSLNFLQMTQTVGSCGIDLQNPIDFLNPIRYHTAWKGFKLSNLTQKPNTVHRFLKGYGIQTGIVPFTRGDTSTAAEPRMPYDTAVKYLDKIVALSKKEDFELVFVMLPYNFMPEERQLFAWLKDYAKQKDIPYLNYCEEEADRIGFDYAVDFADPGHTNYSGAYKISQDIASFVSEKYAIAKPDNLPNTAQLDKDTQQVYRVLKVNSELSKNPKEYFQRIKEDKDAVLIANVVASTEVSLHLQEAMDIFSLPAQSTFIAVIDGGQKEEFPQGLIYKEELEIINDGKASTIKFHGEDYMPPDKKAKFVIYDKVLERPTFYFYYDEATKELVTKDYPAKPTSNGKNITRKGELNK